MSKPYLTIELMELMVAHNACWKASNWVFSHSAKNAKDVYEDCNYAPWLAWAYDKFHNKSKMLQLLDRLERRFKCWHMSSDVWKKFEQTHSSMEVTAEVNRIYGLIDKKVLAKYPKWSWEKFRPCLKKWREACEATP